MTYSGIDGSGSGRLFWTYSQDGENQEDPQLIADIGDSGTVYYNLTIGVS